MTKAQRWTMLAAILGSAMVFLDGTVMNLALPSDRRGAPGDVVSDARGPDVRRLAATSRSSRRCSSSPAPSPTTTAGGKIFAIGLTGFGIVSVLCGLAPTLELLVLVPAAPGRGRRAARPGLARDPHRPVRGAGPGTGVRHLGVRDLGDQPHRAGRRRPPRRRGELAGGVPDQRPAGARSPCSRRSATWPRRRPRTRPGSFDWLGAFVAVVAVGGLAFGAIRGQDTQWQDPLAWVVADRSARSPSSRSRSSWPAARTRSCRSGLFRRRRVRDDQPLDAADLRRAVHDRPVPGPVPAGHRRLHGDGRRASSACRPGSS